MLRAIINRLWWLLPVNRKTFFKNNQILTERLLANNESIDNLRIVVSGLREEIITLQKRQLHNNNLPVSVDFAYLGNVQTKISVNKNIVILSYDLQISVDGKIRAVTPFCPVLSSEHMNLAVSVDSLFLNVLRPWAMGAADEILLPHIRFGPDNPKLPDHYKKFVAENNEASKLLASALKEENK